MQMNVVKGDILETSADLLVIGSYSGEKSENPFMTRLNELLAGKLDKAIKAQKFEGKVGQSLLLPAPDRMDVEYVMIVGLGKLGQDGLARVAREAAGMALTTAKRLGLKRLALECFGEDDDGFDAKVVIQGMGEAILLANYYFSVYKEEKQKNQLKEVLIVAEDGRDARKGEKALQIARVMADGTTIARDLVNTPGKDMTPTRLAEAAIELARVTKGIKVKILERKDCEKKKMNSFLAVDQGSEEDLKFIHLSYKPEKTTKKKIAVVGKGVTFDSGGLSLKPGASMETMKCDMAGAAAVLGLFATLGTLKPKVEVHGIIAATENMPSGKAIRPGDIVRASNGKTIEILNTDAEGRLTLADALVYAQKLNPDYVVDLATLTGACVVALGEEIAAVMSNDAKLANSLIVSGSEADEKIWEMPLEPRYIPLVESDVADLRNIAKSRYGGSLTAGLFLQGFIKDEQKWAHLDIAGPAFAERPMGSYVPKGGTGFGVRTLANWIGKM